MNSDNNNLSNVINSGNVTIIVGGILSGVFLFASYFIFGDWVSFTSAVERGLETDVVLGVLLFLFPAIVYASGVIEGYNTQAFLAFGRRKLFVVLFASALYLIIGKNVNLFVSIDFVAWVFTIPGMLVLSWIGNYLGSVWATS
jgi:hypothetical protein